MTPDVPRSLHALYTAVLVDFFRVVLRATRPALLYEELQWMLADDRADPFAFVNVCRVVGRHPDDVRRQILRRRAFPDWMLVPFDYAARGSQIAHTPSTNGGGDLRST